MIYFVAAEEVHRIKIGLSRTDPDRRFAALQTASPVKLSKVALMRGGMLDESMLHGRFRDHWSHGEWFDHSEPISSYIAEHATAWLADTYLQFLPPPQVENRPARSEADRLRDEVDHAEWIEAINRKRKEGLEKFKHFFD